MTDPSSPGGADRRRALPLPPGTDALVNATQALAGWIAHAGGAGARAVTPEAVAAPVQRWLGAVQQFAEAAPRLGDELRIVVDEVHAKRLTIQAMRAELQVLDQQLEVLEKVLAPVEVWSQQLDELQRAVLDLAGRLPRTPE